VSSLPDPPRQPAATLAIVVIAGMVRLRLRSFLGGSSRAKMRRRCSRTRRPSPPSLPVNCAAGLRVGAFRSG